MDLVTVGPGAASSNAAPRITFSYAPASIQGLAESTGVARDSGQSSGHQITAMPTQEPGSTASGESWGEGGNDGNGCDACGRFRLLRAVALPLKKLASFAAATEWMDARGKECRSSYSAVLAACSPSTSFREPCACLLQVPGLHLPQEVRRLQSGVSGYTAQS